jgi:DNA-binding PadR family transcriptional regulator
MAQPDSDVAQLGSLQAVVLALVGARPGLTGYKLAIAAERRLGGAWQTERRSVYKALKRIESEGLVASAPDGRGSTTYCATERGEAALSRWMASAARVSMRLDLPTKIAVSRAQDAPQLLRTLDEYERECFERLQAPSVANVPRGSWPAVAMNLARVALDESLQAELRWITIARRSIEDFLAQVGDADEPSRA